VVVGVSFSKSLNIHYVWVQLPSVSSFAGLDCSSQASWMLQMACVMWYFFYQLIHALSSLSIPKSPLGIGLEGCFYTQILELQERNVVFGGRTITLTGMTVWHVRTLIHFQ
jgi:hypothetical protein